MRGKEGDDLLDRHRRSSDAGQLEQASGLTLDDLAALTRREGTVRR